MNSTCIYCDLPITLPEPDGYLVHADGEPGCPDGSTTCATPTPSADELRQASIDALSPDLTMRTRARMEAEGIPVGTEERFANGGIVSQPLTFELDPGEVVIPLRARRATMAVDVRPEIDVDALRTQLAGLGKVFRDGWRALDEAISYGLRGLASDEDEEPEPDEPAVAQRLHWSDTPDAALIRSLFRRLPPVAWDVHGWDGSEHWAGTVDDADAHRIISLIVNALHASARLMDGHDRT